MAITVTVKTLAIAQPHTIATGAKAGQTTTKHVLTFVDSNGNETTRTIWAGNELYQQLLDYPIPNGHSVDVEQEQSGKFQNITAIAKAGTLPATAVPPATPKNSGQGAKRGGSFGKPSGFAPNPERDLSMDLGGLMHDAVTLAAACEKYQDVEETARELYRIKQRVMAAVRDGTINTPSVTVAVETPHTIFTAPKDTKTNPFPY